MERLVIVFVCFLIAEAALFTKEAIHTALLSVAFGRYVRRHHYTTWRELTSLGKLGPGVANPWRSIPWLFAESEGADEALLRWKDRLRIRVRWFATSGIAFLLTLVSGFLGFLVYALITQ